MKWQDLKYLLAYLVPFSAYLAVEGDGWWTWSTVIFAFGIVPVFDAILPVSTENTRPDQEPSRSSDLGFDLLLYLCLPVNYILMYLFLDRIQAQPPFGMEWWGLLLSNGILLGGMGINVAHELGHREGLLPQLAAKFNLLLTLNPHFTIEHNRGHHKNVGTDRDPASARRGDVVYPFIIRSIVGQYTGAWRLEYQRLKSITNPFSRWWKNEMVWNTALQLSYLAIVTWLFGIEALGYAVGVAFAGMALLEVINYVEHYGLRRKIQDSGIPERVRPVHSWNSDFPLGRIILFELTRHSDHHYMANRKYQILRHMEESPQLPAGYPSSMLMALVPPIWFWVMHRALDKYQHSIVKNQNLAI